MVGSLSLFLEMSLFLDKLLELVGCRLITVDCSNCRLKYCRLFTVDLYLDSDFHVAGLWNLATGE